MKKLIILLFLILNTYLTALDLTKEEKIWLTKNPDIPLVAPKHIEPYAIKNTDGTFSGVIPDYLNKISELLDSNIYIKRIADAGKGHKLAHEENFHGHSILVDSILTREIHNLTHSYMKTPLNIFTSIKNEINLVTPKDLQGKKVAILKGHLVMVNFIKNIGNVTPIELETPKEQLTLLQNGKVDAVIGYVNYNYFIDKLFLTNVQLSLSLEKEVSIHMGVSDKHLTLKSILNKAIKLIPEEELYKIQSKWFKQYSIKRDDYVEKRKSLKLTQDEENYLKKKPYLNVMHVDEFYPFTFLKDDKPVGYTVDVMKLMGEHLNKDIRFITNPWDKQLENIKNGSLDIMPYVVKTKEREKFIDFTSYTHLSFLIGFSTHKTNQIRSVKDLFGKTVAVVKDSFMFDYLKEKFPNIILYATKNVQESLEAVIHNKAYATLDNVNTLEYLMKEGWLNQLKIETVDDLGLPHLNKLHMGVKKGNTLLKSILEKTHAAIQYEEINKIKKKWFKEEDTSLGFTAEEIKYLASKPYLSVMSLRNFQPFNFVKDGKFLGYSVEMIRLIGKMINKEIKFVQRPWSEQLDMLKNGKLDIIPHLAVNEERKKYIDYTNFPHLTFLVGFAINKNHDISSMEDLKDKKIAVVNKYYLHDHLKKVFPEIELVVTKSTQEAVEAVAKNEAFAVVDNIPTLNYFIQEKWLTNLKIDTVDDFGISLETKMPMGVTKGNHLLKSILEKVNDAIPHSQVAKLRQEWIEHKSQKEINQSLSDEELTYLKKKKKILMCVSPDWPPFEQIDENGKLKGIGADIMKIVSKSINTPIELLPTLDWSQSLQSIRDRKCDILPVAMDIPSRRDAMNFTKPYVTEPFVIATRSEELFIKDASELSNKKVGIIKSYAFIEVLKSENPSIEIIDVKDTKEGLERVRSGELFGYIDTMPTIGYSIQKYSMLDLKIAGRLEFDVTLSVASRNDEPLLNSIMQKALNEISQERLRSLVGKWISIKVTQEFDYRLLWQIGFIFFIITLVILYKNRAVNIINKKLIEAKEEIEEQHNMVDKYVLIITTNLKGQITDVNEAYCRAIGYTKEELISNSFALIKHPDTRIKDIKNMWAAISKDKPWSGEIKNLTKQKETIHFFINIESIFKDGKKIGYRSICENITDKKRIEELSITDQLTKLYNRVKLEEVFENEINRSRRYKQELSVILLDIDHFKSVNDTYGHDIGDVTLKNMAKILKENIRSIDTVGRWGGEEFIILAPETNTTEGVQLAEKIRRNIEDYEFKTVGRKTSSFGVATFVENDTQQSLLKKADKALYQAKENGRNRVEIFK